MPLDFSQGPVKPARHTLPYDLTFGAELWPHLSFYADFQDGKDLVVGNSGTLVSDAEFKANTKGAGLSNLTIDDLLYYPSASDYALIPGGSAIFAVAVNITGLTGAAPALMSFRETFADGLWEIYESSNRVTFAYRTGGSLKSCNFSGGSWPGTGEHTIVIGKQWDGARSTFSLYIDGVHIANDSAVGNVATGTQTLTIGALASTGPNADDNVLGEYHSAFVAQFSAASLPVAVSEIAKKYHADPFYLQRPDPAKVMPLFFAEQSAGEGVALDTAVESDAALDLGRASAKTLETATETDLVLVLSRASAAGLGFATETDIALPISVATAKVLEAAAETNTALDLLRASAAVLGIAEETGLALDLTPGSSLETAVETDQALPISRASAAGLAAAVSFESALPISKAAARSMGLATESDTALLFDRAGAAALGIATEVDQALPILANAQVATVVSIAVYLDPIEPVDVFVADTAATIDIEPLGPVDVYIAA